MLIKKRHKAVISICLAFMLVFSLICTPALANGEAQVGIRHVVEQPGQPGDESQQDGGSGGSDNGEHESMPPDYAGGPRQDQELSQQDGEEKDADTDEQNNDPLSLPALSALVLESTQADVDPTTFVLSNEEGGLIDQLIKEGYGNSSLYGALVALEPGSGGVISEQFLETLAACPAESEIFTAPLTSFSPDVNNPIGINSDGTLIVAQILGRDYYGDTGYSTYPDSPSATKLFTYADSPQYYIDAGSLLIDGQVRYYKAFAIAWSPGVKVAGTATDSSVTMAPGNTGVSTDSTWEIDIIAGTLKGAAGDDLSPDLTVTGLPSGLTWTARNNGSNKILVTVAGTASPAVSGRTAVSVVVKSSAAINGATDSDTISLYVYPNRRYPIALAVNQNTNTIYTANKGSLDVTVMDGATDTVKATIGAGTYPSAIAANPDTNKVYVTNQQDKTVMVIDGATNKVIATLPTGTYPVDLVVNRASNIVYVANNSSKNVTVIDGATDTVLGTVTAGNSPYDLAVNENTNRIYTANNYDKTVSVIDGFGNTLITNVTSDTGPYRVAVNQNTNKIYVTNLKNIINGENGTVTVIDGATNTVTSSISVGVQPKAVVVNPTTNRVYVANLNNDNVMVIDGATDAITATVNVGDGPLALGINTITNKIYVANCGDDTVTVIDGATNSTGSVAAGDYPCAVAVNEASNKAYIANQYSDFLTIIATLPPIPPAAPTIAPNGGNFSGSVEVTISGSDGTIYYTTDGTDPTESGTRTEYTAPFTLTQTATVKAAVQNGAVWSGVTSAEFTVAYQPLTFVLSNEEGGLIDELIAAGYGTCNLYQGLVGLAPASNGVISEDFLDTLANCPGGSQIFTQKLNDYAGQNVALAINTDGTVFTTTSIRGRTYHGQTGYATYPDSPSVTRELFTYATGHQYYIDTGFASGVPGLNYRVFAIAWSGASAQTPAAPTIDPDGGTFTDSVDVTITGSGGAVYYTRDGSDPRESSTRNEYTGQFTLTSSATVRAAVQGESGWSEVASATFSKKSVGGGGGGSSQSASQPEPEPIQIPAGPVVAAPVTEPADLAGHWAHNCVMALLKHGVISGYPDQTIRPGNEITRAEAAALLVSAMGLQDYQLLSQESPYQDELPAWARQAVLAATEKGLMKGYPDGTFQPEQKITRAEMCVALMQAFPHQAPSGFVLGFSDAGSIPDWARPFVEMAAASEVVSGYPDNTFQPDSNIKRGEAFSIICRLMGYHGEHAS